MRTIVVLVPTRNQSWNVGSVARLVTSKEIVVVVLSKKFLVSNFNNYKMVDSRPVMEQFNELLRIFGQYTQHGLKMDESISVSSVIDKLPPSWKDFKHTLKHGKDDLSLVQLDSHLRIEESQRAQESDKGKCKEVVGPSVNMTEVGDCRSGKKNNANAGGWGKGSKDQSQDQVDAIAWWIDFGATTHICKDRCWFKIYEPVEDRYVLYMGDDHFAPIHGKGSVAIEFSSEKTITLFNVLYVPKLRFGYYNNGMFMLNLNKVPDDSNYVYMSSFTVVNSSLWHAHLRHVHYKRLLEMSKDDLIPAIDENPKKCRGGEYYDPVCFQSVGIIHETTAPYTPQQNGVAERKNKAFKEMVNSMLAYSGLSDGFWGEAMVVVRLLDPKKKTLGEKGIDCIFVGYAEHSKAYRCYVIEPNEFVYFNLIIESRDAIFDENRFSSIPRPTDIIPNLDKSQGDDHSDDVPIEGSRDQVRLQYFYCYSIEEDPRTYDKAMKSWDAAFWKEAINDEIGSIIENNTWVLSDLPPGCKPLGCKWIFKRKMKVDGTIDKFKARLVIQGFRQKEGVDYFDTYTPFARITTIRLLLALATIHNPVIHQMDVKTTFLNGDLEEEVYMKNEGYCYAAIINTPFLNGDLEEEVYMKQPKGFVMPGNEHKVYKLIKSLYGLKQAPKQTDQNQVDKTKKFLSLKFSMKDMGEADVTLGIKIKRENKGIVITQSHYIEKILKKFNREDCSSVSTPMDPVEKLKPNTCKPVDQLEYSRAIGCLMYDMTSTRPDIAYAVGRLSKFTSNPSRQHWQAITRVFLLGGGAISWASNKQTCITYSTIESEFVALAAAG
ncbi:zinc finger, CCHC-type containing protein [Tanacetum coccineum]